MSLRGSLGGARGRYDGCAEEQPPFELLEDILQVVEEIIRNSEEQNAPED